MAALNERQFRREYGETAVLRKLRERIKNPDSYSFMPELFVHPSVIQLPQTIRQDEKIAAQAWQNAIPKIRENLEKLARARNKSVKEFILDLRQCFENVVTEEHVRFEATPESSHLVCARFGTHGMVMAPISEDFKVGGGFNWYENNVAEEPLASLVLTHWILEYHKLLEKHVGKKN